MDGNNDSGCCCQGINKIKRQVVNKNLVNNPIDRGNSYYFNTKQNITSTRTKLTEKLQTRDVGVDTIKMNADTKSDSSYNQGNTACQKERKADQVQPAKISMVDDYSGSRVNGEFLGVGVNLINCLPEGICAMKYGQTYYYNPLYPD